MRHLTSFLTLLLLAACTGGDATPPPSAAPGDGDWTLVIAEGEPGDSGITVAEAFEHGPTDDIVAVSGALFVDPDGMVRLCDAIAESFPPQCGGARLVVEGLDLDTVADLQKANGVRWAEGVTLFGSVE